MHTYFYRHAYPTSLSLIGISPPPHQLLYHDTTAMHGRMHESGQKCDNTTLSWSRVCVCVIVSAMGIFYKQCQYYATLKNQMFPEPLPPPPRLLIKQQL
jgi:hypothetical protein